MSNLKKGRPKKTRRVSLDFHFHVFSNVLKEIGGNPLKWSLKEEWIEFSKIYFSNLYPRNKHAKASRDYFFRHRNKLLSSLSSCAPTVQSERTVDNEIVNQNFNSEDKYFSLSDETLLTEESVDPVLISKSADVSRSSYSNNSDSNHEIKEKCDISKLAGGPQSSGNNIKTTHNLRNKTSVESVSNVTLSVNDISTLNGVTEEISQVRSIPIPRTADVSTMTTMSSGCKNDTKSVNFPNLERIENSIFVVSNDGITLPEGFQKEAPLLKKYLFRDNEKNESPLQKENNNNLLNLNVNNVENTETSNSTSIRCELPDKVDQILDSNSQVKEIDCEKFTVPGETSIKFQPDAWGQLWTRFFWLYQMGSRRLPQLI